MSVTAYLMVNKAGSVRINKNGLDVRTDEVTIELRLTIPETFFNRPRPVVDITIPDDLIQSLTPESAVQITASAVAGALGATVEQVMDGLGEVIEQREHRRFEARKASIAPGWIQSRGERQEEGEVTE